jgi:Zn-finger nucleic acid-binding protein
MVVVEYHNIELDYCPACKGVWFDSGELELLLGSHHMEDTEPFLDNILSSPEAITTEKKRRCPICGRKMKRATIVEQPRVIIDMCRRKHGLWFDRGEVSQLISHLAGEHRLVKNPGEEVASFLEEVFKAPEKSKDSQK